MGSVMATASGEDDESGRAGEVEDDRLFEVVANWTQSRGQGECVSVIVHNDTDAELRFEWLDWRGDAISYGTRAGDPESAALTDGMMQGQPNSFFEIDTYSLHPWRIVATSNERELVRVRFRKSCAVRLTELVDSAQPSFGQHGMPWWCEGLRFKLDLDSEKQLAFALASHDRLGKASVAGNVDQHVMQLILGGRRAIPCADRQLVDVDAFRSAASYMQPLCRGTGMACDSNGNIFLADCSGPGRVVKVRRRDGEVLWSQSCRTPLGIAYDAGDQGQEFVLVAARADNKIVCLRAEDGVPVDRFAEHHDAYSTTTSLHHLVHPSGVALHGNLIFVADTGRDRVAIFRRSSGCGMACVASVGVHAHTPRLPPSSSKTDGAFMRAVTMAGGVRGVGVKRDGSAMVVTLQGRRAAAVVALTDIGLASGADESGAQAAESDARVLCWLGAAPDEPRPRRPDPLATGSGSARWPPDASSSSFQRPDLVAVDDSDDILVCDPEEGNVSVFTFDGCLRGCLTATADWPQCPGGRSEYKICAVTVDPVSGFPLLAHALWRQAPPPSPPPNPA